jgi:vesicle-associated membrane protein 7
MAFDFAAVAREKTILALYATSGGNADVVTLEILGGIEPGETRATREKGQSRYFVIHDNGGLNFIVGGSAKIPPDEAFSFLQGLQRKFLLQYPRTWKNSPIYGMQQEFGMQIKQMLENKTNEKIKKIKENLEETQETMTHAMEMALLRDSSLHEMELKTNSISETAGAYERKAISLKRRICWEKYRYYIIGVLIILVVLFLIVVISCGGFSFEYCKTNKK